MERMKMRTINDIQRNIEKIAEVFPNCITEVYDNNDIYKKNERRIKTVDFDKLKELLSNNSEDFSEVYELTWPGKRESIREANNPINKTLRPLIKDSLDWNDTKNIYIKGDNIDALKLLQESYLNKVKVIYIDPPYNTGNDGFIYKDNYSLSKEEYKENSGLYDEDTLLFQDNLKTNPRFHSKWLTMLYSRLLLSRNLLTDDGVIFISIDDNELDNLLKIAKEIFGENNFVGQWNWVKSKTPPNLSKKIKKNIEYIVCFQKGNNDDVFSGIQKVSKSDDPITKPQNTLKTLHFEPGTLHFKTENAFFERGIYGTAKYPNELLNDLKVEGFTNVNPVSFRNRFIWLQDKLNVELENKTKINVSNSLVISYKKDNYSPEVPPNIIDDSVGVDTTEIAGTQLSKLFGFKSFDYPKPVSLIYYLINFIIKENDIVLDFFSGSATTAHAVMKTNCETDKNIRYILVQYPEKTNEETEAYKRGYSDICQIGIDRIRKSGDELLSLYPNSKFDKGFRVFTIDESNMNDVYYSTNEYTQDFLSLLESNVKSDRTDLDLLFGCLIDWGLPLSLPYCSENVADCTIHDYNQGDLIACFDENISDDVFKLIAKKQPLRAVFRDSCFKDSPSKINVTEIFKLLSPDTRIKVI